MKVINQSFEIIQQAPHFEGLLKHIELCGRVSYKSEDKITDDSAKKFVNMLIKNGHHSVLEHGTVCIRRDDLPYLTPYDLPYKEEETDYIATNYRRIIETEGYEMLMMKLFTPTLPLRITVKFITNRAIANEFVRHRAFSVIQESTRYCNYSAGKFDSSITLIKPHWFYSNSLGKMSNDERDWADLMQSIEDTYIELIREGAKPEDARGILPLDLKTELIMTGFVSDWRRFFKLRCVNNAHPQAKELADALKEEFIKRQYYK